MIGRRAVVGLSLLSALLFCALAAQSASAMERTKSNNTTAFTCVKKVKIEGVGFSDAHCDKPVSVNAEFEHVAFANDVTTKIEGTNLTVTESTKKSEPAVLNGTLGGAKVQIECTTVKNNTTNSLVHNAEPVAKQHTFTGVIETQFSTCNVKLIKNCTVAEPIISKANVHGVDKMAGPNGEANAMGLEFVGAGAEETFASIEFKGATCPLGNPVVFPVKGSVIATNGPETEKSAQNAKHSGATLVFKDVSGTSKVKMQTLKLGPNAADFSTIATATNADSKTPLSLTTTT